MHTKLRCQYSMNTFDVTYQVLQSIVTSLKWYLWCVSGSLHSVVVFKLGVIAVLTLSACDHPGGTQLAKCVVFFSSQEGQVSAASAPALHACHDASYNLLAI